LVGAMKLEFSRNLWPIAGTELLDAGVVAA
jgi:hypothetical protein